MDKRFGYYIAAGAAVGLLFGGMLASSSHNSLNVLWGVLVGAAIGWFAAAAAMQAGKGKDDTGK